MPAGAAIWCATGHAALRFEGNESRPAAVDLHKVDRVWDFPRGTQLAIMKFDAHVTSCSFAGNCRIVVGDGSAIAFTPTGARERSNVDFPLTRMAGDCPGFASAGVTFVAKGAGPELN